MATNTKLSQTNKQVVSMLLAVCCQCEGHDNKASNTSTQAHTWSRASCADALTEMSSSDTRQCCDLTALSIHRLHARLWSRMRRLATARSTNNPTRRQTCVSSPLKLRLEQLKTAVALGTAARLRRKGARVGARSASCSIGVVNSSSNATFWKRLALPPARFAQGTNSVNARYTSATRR